LLTGRSPVSTPKSKFESGTANDFASGENGCSLVVQALQFAESNRPA
jgi:hypothetical protein